MTSHTNKRLMVVMLCTAARGGMRAVVEGYRRDGLFDRYHVRWLETHAEGSLVRRLWQAAAALRQLLVLLLRHDVAAVHSHMAMRGSFWRKSLFNSMARAFGVPVIAHLHGSELKQFYVAQPPWRRQRICRELERCAAVLVLSGSWASFVQGIAPAARVIELPNYVVLPGSLAAGVPREQIVLLFLGLVGERKGIFDLLPAFAAALVEWPHLRLVVAGNGEVDRAAQRAAALGISAAVNFAGWVNAEAKQHLLAGADIYVLPSYNENLPVSVIEAMSYGLPVISTRVGGIPELVREGIDGVLVEAGNVQALTTAIVQLARHTAMRHEMGRAGRQRVASHFSDAVVLPRLCAVYDAVLAGRGIDLTAR